MCIFANVMPYFYGNSPIQFWHYFYRDICGRLPFLLDPSPALRHGLRTLRTTRVEGLYKRFRGERSQKESFVMKKKEREEKNCPPIISLFLMFFFCFTLPLPLKKFLDCVNFAAYVNTHVRRNNVCTGRYCCLRQWWVYVFCTSYNGEEILSNFYALPFMGFVFSAGKKKPS